MPDCLRHSPLYAIAMVVALLLIALPSGAATGQQAPGIRIDIGGYKLHILCQGKGSPTVILDAGLGGSSRDWDRVRQGLSQTARVCVYDRAGYGWSDPGPSPRTSGRIVSELHALLERAAIAPPYILVGHSFGGYNMRLYASRYPRETAALVLIDAPHEGQLDEVLQSEIIRQLDPQGLLAALWPQLLARLEAIDLAPLAGVLGLPVKNFRAILGELAAFQRSGQELAKAELDAELPLVVIVHGRRVFAEGPFGDGIERRWLELQRELAARHKNSLFLIAKDSAHAIPLDQPELVVEAVRRLLAPQSEGLAGSWEAATPFPQ